MLRGLALKLISSSRTMQAVLLQQQRHLAAARCSPTRLVQFRSNPALLLPSTGETPRLWSARSLHSTAAKAAAPGAADAATAEAADAAPNESLIYDVQELDPGYFNYAVVTGTLQRLTYVESDKKEDDKWLRFELKVPTPGSDTFTSWWCLACAELAKEGSNTLQDGMMLQACGTLLQAESTRRLGWDRLLPQPALFVESLGVYTQEQSAEKIIQRVVLPAMAPDDLLKLSDGQVQGLLQPAAPPQQQQQQRQQQFAAPAAGAPAEPIRVPGMPEQPSTDIEANWMSVFLENHLWIDQRATKTGRQPDFKKRQQDRGKDAVWLDDRRLPAWVKKNLDKLPGGQPFPTPSFIPDSAANGTDKERAWVELFSNYSAFWDNRLNKLNPRGPDFSPKDKGAHPPLWENEAPDWVKQNWDKLPAPPPKRA